MMPQVTELDSPENLLKDKNSKFYSLANEAGLVADQSIVS